MLYGEINWSMPITISSATTDVSDSQVVIDSQGNVTAVWVEDHVIMSSSHPINGNWSSPIALSNVLYQSSSPKLGIDGNGDVTSLWVENGQIISAVLTSSKSWNRVSLPISAKGASAPALAVDASGKAVAIWTRDGVIESVTRLLGKWGDISELSLGGSDCPQIAISVHGTVIAVWHSIISENDVIMSAQQTIGSAWSSASVISDGLSEFQHNYPQVAIDSHGNAVAMWFGYNNSESSYQNVAILSSFLTFNEPSWTIPKSLSNSGLRNPRDLTLKLGCDLNGNFVALWANSYDGQIFSVESAFMSSGSSWSNFLLVNRPSLYTLSADMAVDSIGNTLATLMTWDGKALNIVSQESDASYPHMKTWTTPSLISQEYYNGYSHCACVLIENTFNAAVVWINFDEVNTVLQASLGSKPITLAPTNLNVEQKAKDFGVYIDYFNTISWQPSPSPDIVQYNIYRNGIFFSATDPKTLNIVDHNALEQSKGTVIYGVASVDSNGSQSRIATIAFP